MGNYLYNGILLPALPDWDKVKYPYAYIWAAGWNAPSDYINHYKLDVCSSPIRYGTVDGTLSAYLETGTESVMYNCPQTDGEFKAWEYYGEVGTSQTAKVYPFWTNHDVISDSDGSVYFAASKAINAETGEEIDYSPIPVSSFTPDPISMTMGWIVGRRIAGQRGKKIEPDVPDVPSGTFPIQWTKTGVAGNASFVAEEITYRKVSDLMPDGEEFDGTELIVSLDGESMTVPLKFRYSVPIDEEGNELGMVGYDYDAGSGNDEVVLYVFPYPFVNGELGEGVVVPESGIYYRSSFDELLPDYDFGYSVQLAAVATHYLYGFAVPADYNGVSLPVLPEWDKTIYPYCYIHHKQNYGYYIWCGKSAVSYDDSTGENVSAEAAGYVFEYNEETKSWRSRGTDYHFFDFVEKSTIIWCDHDIVKTSDGSVYLAASDPVLTATPDVILDGVGYQGAVLPDINEVWTDKETYPYAYISYTGLEDMPYMVAFSSKQAEMVETGGTVLVEIQAHANVQNYTADSTSSNWTLVGEVNNTDDDIVIGSTEGTARVIWTNTVILNPDGTLYLAASEPVPVYES